MHYYTDVLKKYAVFSGRARRKEYWMFVLFNTIIAIVASVLDGILGTPTYKDSGLISNLYGLAVFLPSLALAVRRLHDTDRSGWWILAPIIAVPFIIIPSLTIPAGLAVGVLVVALFVFYTQDSTPGDNKYGPNPKGVPAA